MKSFPSILLFVLAFWLSPSCAPSESTKNSAPEALPKAELTAVQESTPEENNASPEAQAVVSEAKPEIATAPKQKEAAQPNQEPENFTRLAETEEPRNQKQETKNQKPSPAPASNLSQPNNAPPNHQLWNALLQQYVSANGRVNYKGLVSDKSQLQAYLDELAAHPADKSWSREEQLAYWINAYNAFTVKLILDNYPAASIRDIHSGNPWDVQWIKLGGKTFSLNNIENDIIRKQFSEPRIHFAVNCAANSCPPLLNKAWTAEKLETYLSQQARSFINDPRFNKLNPKSVQLSKIFEWYAGDFGNIIVFLNQYAQTPIEANAKISYLEYDWGLNGM